jgi:hypothetical protein
MPLEADAVIVCQEPAAGGDPVSDDLRFLFSYDTMPLAFRLIFALG